MTRKIKFIPFSMSKNPMDIKLKDHRTGANPASVPLNGSIETSIFDYGRNWGLIMVKNW